MMYYQVFLVLIKLLWGSPFNEWMQEFQKKRKNVHFFLSVSGMFLRKSRGLKENVHLLAWDR